jgi:hypothetical protein
VAVKKKPAAKKAAVKKSAAKKTVAKKKTAKKTVAKKTVKKSAVKKTAAKKTVKKSAAKKTVKKSATKKRATSASSVVIPPVPSSSSLGAGRVDVSSTPKLASKSTPARPSSPSAPKQGASGKVLAAIIVGIILLAVVVVTRPDSGSNDATPAPTASESAMPTAEPTAEATSAPVAVVEAPRNAVINWKDTAQTIMTLTWKAPEATEGLVGYKVEASINGGEWVVKSEVPATQLAYDFTKVSEDGATSFRVSTVYSDGQEVAAKSFSWGVTFE